LLHAGLPVSISSDDPSLFQYQGVTLDYVYAFIAWELDLADLKQLALNSILYSSIDEEYKKEGSQFRKFFDYKWERFLDYIIGKY
jgi:adenosine deaminase